MFNQRMRVFLTQNLNLDPHQANNEIYDCIETELFEYAVYNRKVIYNKNVVYQDADILARTLKDANGGVYNYCPCPCGIVFDTNLIPYRQIAIEYIPEPGQQVQVQEFDLQQHILDVQLPLEQIINRPPYNMNEQQRQQFMLQYQDIAKQYYEEFLQHMMAPQRHVNLPQNVHNDNIQGHVENPQQYALNVQVPHPIQELGAHNEIIEQQEVVADEEEEESDEDVDMDIDEEDMEEEEEEIEEEEDENYDFIEEEEEQVHLVRQPPPIVEEPIQCYGISSTCSDDSDNEIRRDENYMNYNRRNAIQYNKISSTERMEGDESDSSDDEYDEIDDSDWSTDSADESNDYY